MLNRYTLKAFLIKSGTRQGCPLLFKISDGRYELASIIRKERIQRRKEAVNSANSVTVCR